MLAKLDWKDILLFLSSFLPALIKALQAALASGQKLDVVTVLIMVMPIFFMSLAVLKTPGSAAVTAALAAKSTAKPAVLGFKKK
jgi:uncharacterized membrane protein YqaE (UPF0057 family)